MTRTNQQFACKAKSTLALLVLWMTLLPALDPLQAQAGGLTPQQEAWLRQIYVGKTGVWDMAAINASNWTNWLRQYTNTMRDLYANGVTNVYAVLTTNNSAIITGHTMYVSFDTNSTAVTDTWLSNTLMSVSGVVATIQAHTNGWQDATLWVQAHSNNLAVDNPPAFGIWGIGDALALSPLHYYMSSTAGVWKLNTSGHIVLGSSVFYDRLWMTNSAGEIVMRALP